MGTTSSTATPLYFTGVSTYSSDFQTIIQRAVQVAQQPITALQTQQSNILSEKQALITLNPDVAALGQDVATLGQLASGQSLAASSSDSSTVSVANTGATGPGSYTISNITSLASAASEMSLTGYANATSTPVSSSGHVNLVVGSNTYQLDLTNNNNLNGLVSAINGANAGVSASVLTTSQGDYLSITANQTGETTLQVNDVPETDLISNTGQGTETSLTGYADTTSTPVSSTGKVDLVVGSSTYHLDITADNNLTGLMNAINNSGAGVTASITGSGPYSLSLTSASGPVSMQLNDLQTPVDLISSSSQGSNANFTLNGTIPEIKPTNTVSDIIPGVSFTLNSKTTDSVTLSVQQDGSQLSTTLQSFVADYNKLVNDVAQQTGTSGGPLTGDLLINTISSDMQQLITYWNPNSNSSIHSLSDLGLQFADNTGQLSFNQDTFNALSANQLSDALSFIGSSTSGFAQLASNFTQLSDPVTGLIQEQENSYDQSNTELSDRISTMETQLSQLQSNVTTQMQQADALCAQLESTQNTLNASLQGLDLVLYGKQTNANGL